MAVFFHIHVDDEINALMILSWLGLKLTFNFIFHDPKLGSYENNKSTIVFSNNFLRHGNVTMHVMNFNRGPWV